MTENEQTTSQPERCSEPNRIDRIDEMLTRRRAPDPGAMPVQADAPPEPRLSEATEIAQRWTVLGPSDLIQPPEPPTYLVKGMIRQGALVCAYGAPGTLKTMWAMDLAVSVAAGLPWLEPLPEVGKGGSYHVTQAPVLWLDLDNGVNRLRERLGAHCRARGNAEMPLYAVSMPRPTFNCGNPQEADLLAAQITELGAGLCIIDNLGTACGGAEENGSEMIQVMANLRWVTEDTGATVLVVHHARKGGATKGIRDGDRLRGHSSIEASLDLALLIEREEGTNDVTIKSTKTRDDPVRAFTAQWRYNADEHGALDQAQFWHIGYAKKKQAGYQELADVLPDLLATMEPDPNQSELVKACATNYLASRRLALRAIKEAVDKGRIIEQRKAPHATAPLVYRSKRKDTTPNS